MGKSRGGGHTGLAFVQVIVFISHQPRVVRPAVAAIGRQVAALS